jgi:peroxiredoxin Q/BCP
VSSLRCNKSNFPGTKQACLFRDAYSDIKAAGYSVFGLSTDSPKSNTNFKTKQNLQYSLLCDPKATLIGAIGLKKSPTGTTRGVAMIDKTGKVLISQPGGPQDTVDVVMKYILAGPGAEPVAAPLEPVKSKEEIDHEKAEVAAEVADTAEVIDAGVKV